MEGGGKERQREGERGRDNYIKTKCVYVLPAARFAEEKKNMKKRKKWR